MERTSISRGVGQRPAGATSILVRSLSVVLFAAGLTLLIGGVYLISLGGSWYYALAGMGISAAAYQLWQGRRAGVFTYLIVLALTVVWALYECGFVFWPLVPRLVAPAFLGAAVLLAAPLLRGRERPASTAPYLIGGVMLAAGFVASLVAMFSPHDIIRNEATLTKGEIGKDALSAGTDWLAYGRTGHGNRFAPLDQINKSNIGKLEVAWTARTGFLADQTKELQDQTMPIHVNGTLYHCGPAGQVSALEGDTGKIKWQFDPKAKSDDWKRCRSLAYFDPGPGDSCGPRVVNTTVDSRLIALRVDNGKPCETFGENGTVNLWVGMGDTDKNYMTNSSGPIIANGKIVLGGRVIDNVTIGEPTGAIRAYDARTGAFAWAWDVGQPDLTTLPKDGQSFTPGTPNAWSLLAFDAELGHVYLPLGNATPDIYGGQRRKFDEEYSSSVVALSLATGKEVWKFQTVHHDLWDYDLPAQPVLADIPDGKGGKIPGLIQTSKRSQVFVLDRRDGKPIKAVVEKPAPQSDGTIKGETYAKTQPYSTEMAAVGTEQMKEHMMWGATPIDQMMCRIQLLSYRYDGEFTTPSLKDYMTFPGPMGGVNLGSTAIDQERNVMVFGEMRLGMVSRLIERDKVTPDMKYTGESGPFQPMKGTPYALARRPFMSPLGIPCLQPPWGTISAVDLATGKQIWQQPAGTAKDLALGKFQPGIGFFVGLPPLGGPMVTKGGIAWHAGTQDYYLRAYDTTSGDLLWKGRLPIGAQTTPMSYMGKDGRQYIVVSAGGARYNMSAWGDYIVAFALPR